MPGPDVDGVEHFEQDSGSPKVLETRVRGTVKWFNVKSGYGFIRRHDNNSEIFVHQSAISQPDPNSNSCSLNDEEEVEFDVAEGVKGLEAHNVTGPDGARVKGSKFAFHGGRGGMYMRGRGRGMGPGQFSNGGDFYYGRGRGRGYSSYGGYDYMDRGGRGRSPFGSRPSRGRGFRSPNYEYEGRGGSRGGYRGRRSDEYGARNGSSGHQNSE